MIRPDISFEFEANGPWYRRYCRRRAVAHFAPLFLPAFFIGRAVFFEAEKSVETATLGLLHPETWASSDNTTMVVMAVLLAFALWYARFIGKQIAIVRQWPLAGPYASEGVSKGPVTAHLTVSGILLKRERFINWTDWHTYPRPRKSGGVVTLEMRHHQDVVLPARENGFAPSDLTRLISAGRKRPRNTDPELADPVGPPLQEPIAGLGMSQTEEDVRYSRELYFGVQRRTFSAAISAILSILVLTSLAIYFLMQAFDRHTEGTLAAGFATIAVIGCVTAGALAHNARREFAPIFTKRLRWPTVHDGVDFGEVAIEMDDHWFRARRRSASYAIAFHAIDRMLVREGFVYILAGGVLIDTFEAREDLMLLLSRRVVAAGLRKSGPTASGGPWMADSATAEQTDMEWSR